MRLLFTLSLLPGLAVSLFAQTATLRGRLSDESGASIPGAAVRVVGAEETNPQAERTAITNQTGHYQIEKLPPGSYLVSASTDNLVTKQPARLNVVGRESIELDLRLMIKPHEEKLTVEENAAPSVSTDSAANASGLVLRGEALDALSDNPDDLQADLQNLAGPSAGPSGGSIYIDGFSGGEIPPKNSIREIRLNQDPFSPEFDKLGYGRIEILTKPGTNKYHGTVDYNLGTDVWNSRNPYAAQKAPLLLNEFEGGASGPINKRSSFTLDAQRNMVDNGSVVNAVILDPSTLTAQPFTDAFKAIQRYTRVSPRLDYQLSENNTVSLRYGVTHGDINGAGIGSFDLISRGRHNTYTNQILQVTESAVLGLAVNETRFQYCRNSIQLVANSASPVLQVLGSFTGGGSDYGHSADTQNSFELQNYTALLGKSHAWKFGVRARALIEDSVSPINFNGTYTFTGGVAPVLDVNNQPVGTSLTPIDSIERYRRTLLLERLGSSPAQIRALGGGASQFSIISGRPDLTRNQLDFGLFLGDNWRARPNLTLAYGLRYEFQTNISDWRDVAPRLSLAWAPGLGAKSRKTVLRAGFGTFYDRFPLVNTLAADRYNGVTQRQYVLTNPDTFPTIPSPSELAASQSPQVVQRIASDLRAPYILQSAVTLEHQLTASTTVAVTYTNSHGLHLLRSRDINAPLPGTFVPGMPDTGLYPLGDNRGPVLLIESSGRYNQNQMIANVNTRLNRSVNLFGFYVVNRAKSDTDDVGTSSANSYDYRNAYGTAVADPYNFQGEYGRAATDIHQRVSFGGSISARWNIRLSPFVVLQSGAPFNITSGTDTFGTSLFNARPGLATDRTKTGLVPTSYGLLDPNPDEGETVLPRNYGRGPSQFTVNLRFSKGVGFGPEKGGSTSSGPALSSGQRQAAATGNLSWGRLLGTPSTSRKYNLIFTMSARNLLNHNNPGPIIGNITSPLFGQANQIASTPNGEGFSEAASNRRLEMQIRFTF
jgi:hypothetical protein